MPPQKPLADLMDAIRSKWGDTAVPEWKALLLVSGRFHGCNVFSITDFLNHPILHSPPHSARRQTLLRWFLLLWTWWMRATNRQWVRRSQLTWRSQFVLFLTRSLVCRKASWASWCQYQFTILGRLMRNVSGDGQLQKKRALKNLPYTQYIPTYISKYSPTNPSVWVSKLLKRAVSFCFSKLLRLVKTTLVLATGTVGKSERIERLWFWTFLFPLHRVTAEGACVTQRKNVGGI